MTRAVDPASVTSRELAEQLVDEGLLVKFYLYPAEFGGSEAETDSRYLPAQAALEKNKFDSMVRQRLADGRLTGYYCQPTDTGESLVPSSLKLIALKSGSRVFVSTIEVWDPEVPFAGARA